MTKVRVIEVHKEDAFYSVRESIMSKMGETNQFHPEKNNVGIRKDGWFHGSIVFEDTIEDTTYHFFYMVRVEEVVE